MFLVRQRTSDLGNFLLFAKAAGKKPPLSRGLPFTSLSLLRLVSPTRRVLRLYLVRLVSVVVSFPLRLFSFLFFPLLVMTIEEGISQWVIGVTCPTIK